MPRPDKETVIQRLQELLQQAQTFERRGSDFDRTADFSNWQSDVGSWLRAGSPHSDDQHSDFLNLRFAPVGYISDRLDAEERWRRDLNRAQHSIKRAIENIQRDWTIPDENAGTATEPDDRRSYVHQPEHPANLADRTRGAGGNRGCDRSNGSGRRHEFQGEDREVGEKSGH